MAHVSPERRLGAAAANASDTVHHHHGQHDPSLGMAGMVLGITVLPPDDAPAVVVPPPARRQLTMVVGPARDRTSETSAMGIAVGDRVSMEADPELSSPGPPLVLRRGEPVDITVVNRLAEPTSIHWHGLEIDSYYDGVHGWSGLGGRTAPMIEPGNSFVVRITPTRAGTFIYHTHLHDYRQLSSGLYGPLIVTEPGETYDPAVDHVLIVGRRNASEASGVLADVSSAVVNGEHTPRWVWRAGGRHRIRLINITPDDIFIVSFLKGDAVLQWRPLTKDGAPVPPAENQAGPARVRIAVGETYDFEYEAPEGRGALWLEVRSASGKWQAQGQVLLR